MGVHGLWQVVHPVARPIALETLGNKKLAIDSSIWLYQFQLAMRDKEGRALANAHILGFLRRITKLLYYGIKPVFVFDGGAPVIKRSTLSKRKHRKRDNVDTLAKTAEKLLAAQMRQAAVSQAEKKQRQRAEGDLIGEDAVYLEDLPSGIAPRGAPQGSGPNHAPEASTSQQAPAPSPPKKKKKDYHKDQYALPALDSPMASRGQLQDPRMATEEELRDFIEDLRPEDLDVDAEWFHGLSTEVQYEILGDLRLKSRQANFRRVEQMRQAATALDFSRAQIKHLMQRNDLTQKLLSVTDDISRAHIKIPIRIAAERNKHYVLVKNTADDGTGGWVLGVRDPVKSEGNRVENAQSGDTGGKRQDKVVKIDVSEDSDTEDTHSVTDEGDFEEIMPSARKDESSSPDQRKFDAAEVLQRRYSPSKMVPEEEPVPQLPVQEPLFSPTKRLRQPEQSRHPEQDLDESLLAAAATDATLFNDIANSHLGRPSKIQHAPVASSSKQDAGSYSPQRPPLTGHKSTTTDIRNNLFEQDLSSDSEDADMEEVEPASRSKLPELAREPAKTSTHSKLPTPAQPRRPTLQPRAAPMRATPQQASLNAQAKLRNATSFSSFAQTSGSPFPEPSPIPSAVAFDDGSGDVETERVDQGPSLVSSALAQDPDSDEEFEEVDSNKHFQLPIQEAAQQSMPQPNSIAQLNSQSNSALDSPAAKSAAPPLAADQPLFNPPSPSLSPSPSLPARPPAATGAPSAEAPAEGPTVSSAGPLTDDDSAPSQAEPPTRPSLATALPAQESPRTLRPASPAALDQDSDAEEAWSRSPSPAARPSTAGTTNEEGENAARPEDAPDYIPPHFELAPEGRELESDDELDAGDLEEAELTANIRAEEGHFSQFLDDLQHRSLSDMRAEVDAEIAQLEQTRKVDRRNAEEITAQMSKEIMVMLRYFGIPFVVAPMEAEAQCAELTNRSLVDGIITDDSDVFLFGGTRVYKNMFNQNKYVECYLLSDMERELGLSRDKLVQLAHFLGSDYSDGIPGVGPVQGMELMNEFPGEDGLTQFRQWWQKVQTGSDDDKDTHNAFRRRFKKSKKQLFLDDHWPNPQVREAYYRPTVDSNEERFQWGVPDLDGLRGFLAESLGWGVNKVDDLLSPLIKRMQQRNQGVANMQGSLDSFFDVSGGSGRFAPAKANQGTQSQRMQTVIKTWKAKQAELAGNNDQVKSEDEEERESEAPMKQPKRRRAPSRKGTGPSKAARKPSRASRAKGAPPTEDQAEQETELAEPEAEEAPLPRISRPRHSTSRRVDYAEAGAHASSDSEQDAWVDV